MNERFPIFTKIIWLLLFVFAVLSFIVYVDVRIKYSDSIDNLKTIEQKSNDILDSLRTLQKELNEINNISNKISIISPNIDDISKIKLSYYIYHYGKQYENNNLLENIMVSIPYVETGYKKFAKGKAGEVGYYQIHPINITERERKEHDIYDEEYQVRKAYAILNRQFNIFDSVEYAINSYNGWASKENPYYKKVNKQLKKITNI